MCFQSLTAVVELTGAMAVLVEPESGTVIWTSSSLDQFVDHPTRLSPVTKLNEILTCDEVGCQGVLPHLKACDGMLSSDIQIRLVKAQGNMPVSLRSETVTVDGAEYFFIVLKDAAPELRQFDTLRKHSKLLARTGELAKLGGWEVDLRTGEITWTAETYRIHDLPTDHKGDLSGAIDYYAPEARDYVREAVRRAYEEGIPFDFVRPLITAKGRRIMVRGLGEAVIRGDEIVGLRGIIQDVTEEYRRQDERDEALRRAETYQTLFRISNTLPAITGFDGYFKLLSESWTEALGWSQAELSRVPFLEFIHKDDRDSWREKYAEICEGRCHKATILNRFRCKDGSERWLSWNLSSGPDAVYCVATDETETAKLIQRLEKSEQSYRSLSLAIPLMVWAASPDGTLEFANHSVCRITGKTHEELLTPEARTLTVHPDDAAEARATRERAFREGKCYQMELRMYSVIEKRYVWFLSKCVPVRDGSGEIIRWLGVATEIDSQRREREREQLVLNELDHRINNNLTTVLSLASQTAKRAASIQEFLPAFEGRIRSLSLAHATLSANNWRGVRIRPLIDKILRGVVDPHENPVHLFGDDDSLPNYLAQPLSLILNELAVNALKHGALSSDPPRAIRIQWTRSAEHFDLLWSEDTTMKIDAAQITGFGTSLIKGLASHQLGGTAVFTATATELQCALSAPLRREPEPYAFDRKDHA